MVLEESLRNSNAEKKLSPNSALFSNTCTGAAVITAARFVPPTMPKKIQVPLIFGVVGASKAMGNEIGGSDFTNDNISAFNSYASFTKNVAIPTALMAIFFYFHLFSLFALSAFLTVVAEEFASTEESNSYNPENSWYTSPEDHDLARNITECHLDHKETWVHYEELALSGNSTAESEMSDIAL